MRVVVADDEPLARSRLRKLLAQHDDVELSSECRNGDEVVDAVRCEAPDVLFLDVQMPDRDGFEVLAELEPEELPIVVFVSAYDEYALAAFEAHALDYLLKPFDDERFEKALARVREQVGKNSARDLARSLLALRDQLLENDALSRTSKKVLSPYARRIPVRDGARLYTVAVEAIEWIEASGVYATLHAGGKEHLARSSLAELERRLDPAVFARIHRSAVVRVDAIVEIRNERHGDGEVVLASGEALRLSRRYRARCEALLGL